MQEIIKNVKFAVVSNSISATLCACVKLEVDIYFAYFAGSKDETFFDSQPWLESDCEDDFFSVNGGKEMFQIV